MIASFDPAHLDRLYPNLMRVIRRRVDYWGIESVREGFALSAHASTLVIGGEVLACVAVAKVRPGVGSLSGLFHKDAKRLHFEALDEAARMFLKSLRKHTGLSIVFTDAYERVPASGEWLSSLGFKPHGPQYTEPAAPGERLTLCQGWAKRLEGERPCLSH